MDISVVDSGIGNIKSVCNMILKVGGSVQIVSSPEQIADAKVLILPGVGAFDHAMKILKSDGWIEPLYQHAIIDKKPILGVCLGMHIMTRSSQEGLSDGLGFIEADTVRFSLDSMVEKKAIPNMGWNTIKVQKKNDFFDLDELEARFYFVHSYHVVCDNQCDILTTTNYGYDFTSSFQKGNIIGVQFHPEKSHKFGYKFFKQFIEEFAT